METDVCTRCFCLWFDPGERQGVPSEPQAEAEAPLPEKARHLLAIHKVEEMARQAAAEHEGPPELTLVALPGYLGFPVETGTPPVASKPWTTWWIATAAAFVFVALVSAGVQERVFQTMGFVPALWHRHFLLTVVTSFFLHGGLMHLAGNAYFLLVFGDNVEDNLGPRYFALLLGLSHAAGLAFHSLFDPRGDVPLIGASGGISGVIAYYAVAFPSSRLSFFMPSILGRFALSSLTRGGGLWATVPAAGAFVIWLGLQGFGAWSQISGFSNVSSLGHLGGAAVGLTAGVWAWWRKKTAFVPVFEK